jgi:hypothetical protein
MDDDKKQHDSPRSKRKRRRDRFVQDVADLVPTEETAARLRADGIKEWPPKQETLH